MSELKMNSQIVLLKDIKMENSRKEANMLKGGKKKLPIVSENYYYMENWWLEIFLFNQFAIVTASLLDKFDMLANPRRSPGLRSVMRNQTGHFQASNSVRPTTPPLSQFPLLWNGEKWPFPIHFQAYYKDYTRQGSVKKSVLRNQSALLCCLEAFYLSFLGLIFPIYRMGPHLTFLDDILPSYM